jgi:hypothetical protein
MHFHLGYFGYAFHRQNFFLFWGLLLRLDFLWRTSRVPPNLRLRYLSRHVDAGSSSIWVEHQFTDCTNRIKASSEHFSLLHARRWPSDRPSKALVCTETSALPLNVPIRCQAWAATVNRSKSRANDVRFNSVQQFFCQDKASRNLTFMHHECISQIGLHAQYH